MSKRFKIPEGASSLMAPDEKEKRVEKLRSDFSRFESRTGGFDYPVGRVENDTEYSGSRPVELFHGNSFLNEIIPGLLEKKPHIKILVLGAGNSMFCDQIRKHFGEKVSVMSTGLSKKTARSYRSKDLHPDDIKTQSIFFLKDFPEFDLIIDTFGEQFYSTNELSNTWWEEDLLSMRKVWQATERNELETERYLIAVIHKLLPGGVARIAPFPFIEEDPMKYNWLDKIGKQNGAQIRFLKEKGHSRLIITKQS